MNKAIFLDRDGTLNVEKNYLYRVDDFELLPNVLDGLKLLQEAGFLLIILTNQSGIARGYYSEEQFRKLNAWMLRMLSDEGIKIARVYYCPHLPTAHIEKYRVDCSCRKPRLGMYERAIKEFDISVSESFAIGDKIRDCAICGAADCRGFLIGDTEDGLVINQVKSGEIKNVRYAADLFEASNMIIKSRKGEE